MNELTSNMDDMNDMNVYSSSERIREQVTFGTEDRGWVYAVASRIVGADDAEDVAQEALLLAYRHRASFRGDSKYRTWLYRIASTTALGYLRKKKRSRELLAANDGYMLDVADDAKSPEASLADAETADVVRLAVARLEPKYRDVIVARADANEPETAKRLNISVANVKIRAHRARSQLRSALAGCA
ncbi:MAG: sigma-70 family RNA polymerase sigma factor [Proteobacteria bacterium]|nr:sigma-70 family RNA polymerase sigma factor [Pseudomonadota bacterium]